MELPTKLLSKRDMAAPSSRVLLGAEVTARLAEVRLKDLFELLVALEVLDVIPRFARRVGLALSWLFVSTPWREPDRPDSLQRPVRPERPELLAPRARLLHRTRSLASERVPRSNQLRAGELRHKMK